MKSKMITSLSALILVAGLFLIAVSARATVVDEMGTFFPVIGLLVAVISTRMLRRRKVAQLARQQSILG